MSARPPATGPPATCRQPCARAAVVGVWSIVLLMPFSANPSRAAEEAGAHRSLRAARTNPPSNSVVARRRQMWLSPDEIRRLPVHGAAWEQVYAAAHGAWGEPRLADQNHDHNTLVLAGALVAVRLGNGRLADRVRSHLRRVPGTEAGGRTLALGRNLHAYLVAAGLVELQDPAFDRWLDRVRFQEFGSKTLVSTHERRANNWGTHAGASRIAAAIYLNDQRELERSAQVFAGWLGDRDKYASFKFGDDLSWHADPARPVGINPLDATRFGRQIDGFLPDDIRRGGPFQWPPEKTNYPWAALNGVVIQAELLHRQGYDAWNWSDRAIYRAVAALERLGWYVNGEDEEWLVHLVNRRYGARFRTPPAALVGKNFGWTDWTHASPWPPVNQATGRPSRQLHNDR